VTLPNRLTCEDLFRRLDDYLDRELSSEESERIREHLETCAVCANEYNFEASVLRSVKEKLRRLDVPSDLMEKIRRRISGGDEK